MSEKLLSILESDKLDLTKLEDAFDIKFDITFGMTPFQIRNFVMNKKEFPNDFAQFLQARMEIYHRVNTIVDLWYQYRECVSKIKLAEGRIEKFEKEETYTKIREAKIELQKLEIEKNRFRKDNIKNQIIDKSKESYIFYEIYKKHKHFETDPPEKISMEEEEYWRIKSAYYPELMQRYGLTPSGFLKLPHENGGLNNIIKLTNNENQDIKKLTTNEDSIG